MKAVSLNSMFMSRVPCCLEYWYVPNQSVTHRQYFFFFLFLVSLSGICFVESANNFVAVTELCMKNTSFGYHAGCSDLCLV